ncbi:hypothetical protein [Thermomonospora umbrina]|nr:hypothetical protein [Thermomonospora umbrina]
MASFELPDARAHNIAAKSSRARNRAVCAGHATIAGRSDSSYRVNVSTS